MKKNLLFFLLFVSIKSFSQSDDEFQYVTSSKDGSEIYILFEKDSNGIKEFWIKIMFKEKNSKGKNGKIIKSGGGYMLEYIKMDCSEKEYSSTNAVIYDKNGDSKKRPIYYDSYNEKVIPGTVMSGVYKYFCELE